jgi:hypothetical protein
MGSHIMGTTHHCATVAICPLNEIFGRLATQQLKAYLEDVRTK